MCLPMPPSPKESGFLTKTRHLEVLLHVSENNTHFVKYKYKVKKVIWFTFYFVSPSLSLVRFVHQTTLLCCADKRIANSIMKVNIERNTCWLYSRLLLWSDGFNATSPTERIIIRKLRAKSTSATLRQSRPKRGREGMVFRSTYIHTCSGYSRNTWQWIHLTMNTVRTGFTWQSAW